MNNDFLAFLSSYNPMNIKFATSKQTKIALVFLYTPIKENAKYPDNCRIVAYHANSGKEIGKIEFKLLPSSSTKKVFLETLVVGKEYRNRGIATYMIKFFEEKVFHLGFKKIEGIFFPNQSASTDSVLKFYAKHNYNIIEKDYDKVLDKELTFSDISKTTGNTFVNDDGYETYGKLQNFETKNSKTNDHFF